MTEEEDDEISLTDSLDRHARYLGIDPVDDSGYLWIAREALDAELPSEWIEVDEEDGEFAGHLYYCNTVTGESTWDHPLDEQYKRMFIEMKEKGEGDRRRHRSSHSGERVTNDNIKGGNKLRSQQEQNGSSSTMVNSGPYHVREGESCDFVQDGIEYIDGVGEEYNDEEVIHLSTEKKKMKNLILKSVLQQDIKGKNDSSEEPEPLLQQKTVMNDISEISTTHEKSSASPWKKLTKQELKDEDDPTTDNNTMMMMPSDVSAILREERTRRNEADALAEKTEQMLVDRAERVERLLEDEQMKRKRLEKEFHEERKLKVNEIELAKAEIEKLNGQEKIAKQKIEEERTKFKEELGKLMEQIKALQIEKEDISKKHNLEITELLANAEIEKKELRQCVVNSENSIETLQTAKSQLEAKLKCNDEELDARVRASLEEAEESYNCTLESLKQELLASQNLLELREKELACQVEEFDGLEAKVNEEFTNKTQELLKNAIKESENEVKELKVELANSEVKCSSLVAQCEALHQDAKMVAEFSNNKQEEMTLAIKESKNEVESLKVELANSNVTCSSLEAQCEALRGKTIQLQEAAAHHEVPPAHVNIKETSAEESCTDRENKDTEDRVIPCETERSTKAEGEAATLASRNAECQILQSSVGDEAHNTKAQTFGADAKRNIAEQLMTIDRLKVEVENLRSKLSLSEEAQDQKQQKSGSRFNQESLASGPQMYSHSATQQQIPILSAPTGRIPHQLAQGSGILTSGAVEHAQMPLPQLPLPSSPTEQKLMLRHPPSTPLERSPTPLICNLNVPSLSSQKRNPPSATSVSPPQQVVGQMVAESLYPAEKEVLQNNSSSVLTALQERVNALQMQTRTFVQESLQALNTTQSNGTSSSQQLAENTNLINWYRTQSELQDERISRLLMQATTTSSPAGGNTTAESPFSSPRSTLAKHHLETGESPMSRSLDMSSLSILSLPAAEYRINNANGYGYRSGYWKNRYMSSLDP